MAARSGWASSKWTLPESRGQGSSSPKDSIRFCHDHRDVLLALGGTGDDVDFDDDQNVKGIIMIMIMIRSSDNGDDDDYMIMMFLISWWQWWLLSWCFLWWSWYYWWWQWRLRPDLLPVLPALGEGSSYSSEQHPPAPCSSGLFIMMIMMVMAKRMMMTMELMFLTQVDVHFCWCPFPHFWARSWCPWPSSPRVRPSCSSWQATHSSKCKAS